MTSALAEPVPTGPRELDHVGEALLELAQVLNAHCLVEVARGRVLSHAVTRAPIPASFLDALVQRRIGLLQADVGPRRSIGVLGGAAVVAGQLQNGSDPVLICPLPGRRAWLWLLPDHELTVAEIAWAADLVEQARNSETDPVDAVRAALFEHAPLPKTTLPPATLWLCAVDGTDPQAALTAATRLGLPTRVLAGDSTTYLLLSTDLDERVLLNRVAPHLEALGSAVLARVDQPTRLSDLRGRLDEALRSLRSAGGCRTLSACRSQVALARLGPVLDTLATFPGDPVERFLTADRTRVSQFAATLLAWLDAHGDIALAAATLTVHPNTLRYRVKRAMALLAVDLDDPDSRLEVHLRLRREETRLIGDRSESTTEP